MTLACGLAASTLPIGSQGANGACANGLCLGKELDREDWRGSPDYPAISFYCLAACSYNRVCGLQTEIY